MRAEEIIIILQKYGKGECTADEINFVETWYNRTAKENAGTPYRESIFMENAAGLDLILALDKKTDLSAVKKWNRKVFWLPLRIAVAAAALAAVVFGIWFFSGPRHPDAGQDFAHAAQDIAPGRNTAILKLPNGETIHLSDAKSGVVIDASKLTYNDGSTVHTTSTTPSFGHPSLAGGKILPLTASTPRGGTYQVTLPDGTHVWLNADSKLSFPSQFSGSIRKVLLSGEAYFEVAKNKARPFIVESEGQEVEVLGTHFNISAYSDEGGTKTTLLEGSVRVSLLRGGTRRPSHSSNDVILSPNQQSIVTGYSRIKVIPADVDKEVAWQRGDFVLKNEDFKSVMRKIARWYDAEVVYDTDAPNDLQLLGVVARSKNLSAVLKMIEATGKVKFKVEGKKITVMK